MGNSIWDNLKKTAQEFDLIPKDLTPEEQAKRDEQALYVAATGFEELGQLVGGVRKELGPDSPIPSDASQIDPGIQPTIEFLNVPPNEGLKQQLLERVYNPAVAAEYIRFMKAVARAKETGDPEADAYKLAIGIMSDADVTPQQLHEKLMAILQAIEAERQAKYAENQRIESDKIGGLKAVVKNASDEHRSIADKIKQAELAAEAKIKEIQSGLARSTEAYRARQQELEKAKAIAQSDLQKAEQELVLKASGEEAALNDLTNRFRQEQTALQTYAQVGNTEQPKSATPKK